MVCGRVVPLKFIAVQPLISPLIGGIRPWEGIQASGTWSTVLRELSYVRKAASKDSAGVQHIVQRGMRSLLLLGTPQSKMLLSGWRPQIV